MRFLCYLYLSLYSEGISPSIKCLDGGPAPAGIAFKAQPILLPRLPPPASGELLFILKSHSSPFLVGRIWRALPFPSQLPPTPSLNLPFLWGPSRALSDHSLLHTSPSRPHPLLLLLLSKKPLAPTPLSTRLGVLPGALPTPLTTLSLHPAHIVHRCQLNSL